MQPDLTISIISSDNLNLLLPCLRSVFENIHQVSLEVYVVDNASTDGTAESAVAEFPQVKVIRNKVRQGFSTNNNLVLRRGQGRYLMLLNDDTLLQPAALDEMVVFMDAHPAAGAVGSFLFNPDGSFQPCYARLPHPVIEALWPDGKTHFVRDAGANMPVEVDAVSGCSFMVRREIIEQVGLLDTDFDPIYSEEIDWCHRIRNAGWRVYALPQARIIHYGSQTMNRALSHKYGLLLSHKALYFRKHWGRKWASVFKLTLGIATLGKLVWWSGKAVLPTSARKHDRQRASLQFHILSCIPSM